MIISIIIELLYIIFYNENSLLGMFFYNSVDTFMDFFNNLKDGYTRRPYENGCIYPPFAYLIYAFFSSMIPKSMMETGLMDYFSIRNIQTGLISFAYFLLFGVLLYTIIIVGIKKFSAKDKLLLGICLLMSNPFLYALERGNMIIWAGAFLLFFFVYKDSDVKWQREIAFICLAFAASLKIYPELAGLILVSERRWKDVVKCLVYGLIVFIVPFAFMGGISEVFRMIENIKNTSNVFESVVGYNLILVLQLHYSG